MSTPPQPPAHLYRWRYTSIFVAVVCVVILASILATRTRTGSSPAATPAPAESTMATAEAPTVAVTAPTGVLREQAARAYLDAVAGQVLAVPTDTAPGPYFYVRTEVWARAENSLFGFDTQRWRAADGSGLTRKRGAPGPDSLKRLPEEADRARLAAAPLKQEEHQPDGLRPVVAEPIAEDPTVLGQQLRAHVPPQAGPARLLAGIADMADTHYLNQQQRVAVLRLLARIPGIQVEARTDLTGRAGVAVCVTTPESTATLLVDLTTGRLLAYDEWFRSDAVSGIHEIRLFLDAARRTEAGA
jgi:hypothetical protein